MLPLLLLLALVPDADARDTRKPWVRKAEDGLTAPPTTPGTPVEGTRTFEMSQEGWRGCWDNAMYPAVESLGGVDLVDAGTVVASGWEVPSYAGEPFEPAARLAQRGIALGKPLGYVPTRPGPSERDTAEVPGTLYEAGPGRVAWLSHEEPTVALFWYAGDRPPEALTRCLVPWEDLVARTEAALAEGSCDPVIDELYPHTWGAPTPGALALLERCDAQWRERFAAVSTASDPEEILAVYRYHMVRWSGPKEPLLFPTAPLKWSAHIWGPLDAALARTDITPAQQVIFPLLRRAFAREAPVDHEAALPAAFAAYLPRIAGLAALGVEESALLTLHPLLAPRWTWGKVSRERIAPFAAGPALWTVADVLDESTTTVIYDGEGERVDRTTTKTPAYAAYQAWEAREAALVDELATVERVEGDCHYITPTQTTTSYETYSTYSVITTRSMTGSAYWWCPPALVAAREALDAHRKAKPTGSWFQHHFDRVRLGRERSSVLRPVVRFTIGSASRRWALDGALESYFHEFGGGAREEYPSTTRTAVPVRPPLTCGTEGAPPELVPFLGAWSDDRRAVRFCYEGGKIVATVVATSEGNFVDAYTYDGKSFKSDGAFEIMAAWTSKDKPFFQLYRRVGDTLVMLTADITKNWGDERVLRPMKSELPFTELTASRNYGSAVDKGFTEASAREELDVARGMLAETLLRERPEIAAAFRADTLAHLRATLAGDELTRTLFLLGYPVEGNIPASVRLLDAWDRNTTQDRAARARPWAYWSAGVR